MVKIITLPEFEKSIKKIKDKKIKERIKKQIKKIIKNPELGEFLRYDKKNERKLYVGSFRLIYSYKNEVISLLDFDKRSRIYKKLKR